MQTLTFNEKHLELAQQCLMRGGVVILPTDTVYGLACHPDHPEALERIRAMKGRDRDKPFQLLAADDNAVWRDGALRLPDIERLVMHWPGALTLVLPTQKGHSEGYRVPKAPLLQKLLAMCGGTLRCTSVNKSGEPPARDAAEARRLLGEHVDLILDGGPANIGVASTVAILNLDGSYTITRQGMIRLN
jgi:L-threonylcarbamoyladenylate synthase